MTIVISSLSSPSVANVEYQENYIELAIIIIEAFRKAEEAISIKG